MGMVGEESVGELDLVGRVSLRLSRLVGVVFRHGVLLLGAGGILTRRCLCMCVERTADGQAQGRNHRESGHSTCSIHSILLAQSPSLCYVRPYTPQATS